MKPQQVQIHGACSMWKLKALRKFLLLATILMGCGVQMPPQNATSQKLAEETSFQTVALVHTYQHQTRPFCTGVWVSPSIIMTANHCVEGLTERLNYEQVETDVGNDDVHVSPT